MRSSRNSRHFKKNNGLKVHKRKRTNRTSGFRGHNHNIPLANIEDLNEIVRSHRSQRAAGLGSWKVVPKDSCEVYKDRKRRETESKNREPNEGEIPADENDSQEEKEEREGRDRKKRRKQQEDKRAKKKVKKIDKKYKNRKRRHRCSSCTSSCTSTSFSTSCTTHS